MPLYLKSRALETIPAFTGLFVIYINVFRYCLKLIIILDKLSLCKGLSMKWIWLFLIIHYTVITYLKTVLFFALFKTSINICLINTGELFNIMEHHDSTVFLSPHFTRRIRELDSLPEIKKKAILNILNDLIRANS